MDDKRDFVVVSEEDGILKISISRPEKRNALTMAMYSEMTRAIESAEAEMRVRAILIHGTDTCFTSGNDLHDFSLNPPEGENSPVFCFLRAICQATKPLVAMVSGAAVGIGTTMLLHCDLVYADESAKFQLPFANLGLCPEAASSYLLPKLVGSLQASEMLLLGEAIGAEKAADIGLINQVLNSHDMPRQVWDKCVQLAAQPPESIRLTKALLKENQSRMVAEVMSKEGELFLSQLAKPEAQEAINAFLEGRKPVFL